ncbi:MAG: DUF2207 domain-containing protein [Trueperaceae bacterium]|nr:DUF2207 domain-containing protein [Trueperaceae bacterium]
MLTCLHLAWAQGYEWRDVVQNVDVERDGTVIVTDERTLVATSGDFNEAFICLDLASNQSLALLGGGALGEGPDARAYTQPCEDGSGGTELVVEMDKEVRVAERRVFYRYALSNTLDYYSDVTQWYWIIFEQNHLPVEGYKLTVNAPGTMSAPYDAFVHRFRNPETPTVTLSEDRDRLTVTFERIPDGDGVEIRYLMAPGLFERQGDEAGLERLLRDETRFSRVSTVRRVVFGAIGLFFAVLPWVIAIGVPGYLAFNIARDYLHYGRDPARPSRHTRFEPPSDLPPFAVATLLDKSYRQGRMRRAFSATVMDLVRLGYGEFRSERGGLFGLQTRFEMTLDLGRDQSTLHPLEVRVLGYLHKAAKRTGEPDFLDFDELKAYSKINWRAFLVLWGKDAREWVETEMGGKLVSKESADARGDWAALSLIAGVLGIPAFTYALALGAQTVGALFFIATLVCITLFFIANYTLAAWRDEVADEVYAWQDFRRTLRDYTAMEEAPDDFFRLWDRYFCYAAALGVSRRFLRNVRRAMPERNLSSQPGTGPATSTWTGSRGGANNFLSGSGLGDIGSAAAFSGAVRSLSGALKAKSASSGGSSSGSSRSSGGSSPGGSSSGGGGSSGGR